MKTNKQRLKSGVFIRLWKRALFFMVCCLFLSGTLVATASSKAVDLATTVSLQSTVTGTVTDDTGSPLPGASVVEKGTANGVQTDFDGNFSLEVGENATLVVSYLGFETKEVPVNGQLVLNISISESASALDEVVVVGYGSQISRKVTGAISKVGGVEIAEQPVISADQALQGRVAGVNIVGSGVPGANPTIRIRGLGSALNSDPLFVVDGIPVGQNALNDIHPDNIQDISVLKDAASTAIYGSRAANGVILITTKKGKVGKPQLSFSTYYGVQDVPDNRKYDLLNTDEYINFAQNRFGVSAPRFDDYDFQAQEFRAGTPSAEFIGVETDWQDEVLSGGTIQDYYVNYSGGSENITYNIGGGYFDQDGLSVDTYFRRVSLNTNLQASFGDRLKIGHSMVLSRSVGQQDNSPAIRRAIQMMPYIPVFDDSRPGGYRATDFADNADPFQPVLNSAIVDNEQTRTNILATLFAQYELFDGLNLRVQAAVENSFTQFNNYVPTYDAGEVAFNFNDTPTFRRDSRIYLSPVLTSYLDYNKTFGDHSISAVVGYETQQRDFEEIQAESTFLPNEDVRNPATSPVDFQRSSVSVTKTQISAFFGRFNYDYKDKYLIGASIRRDKSSVFAPENNVSVFPAVSAGWRISEEPFFSGLKETVTDLKIRGSWGENGNTATAPYSWDPTIFSNLIYVSGENEELVPGLAVNTLFNRNLQWETIIKSNIGLDAEFFNGKMYATFEWFNNRSEDLIIQVPLPNSAGFDGVTLDNVGTLENRGLELALGYSDYEGEFTWSVDANVSFIENEVISLGAGEDSNIAGPIFQNTASPATRAEVGEPIGFYYGWQVDRIYQNQSEVDADNAAAAAATGEAGATRQGPDIAPGDIRFKDLNGDGIIDGDDRTNLGHYLPDVNVGLNTSMKYKNFDLSANFVGAFGFEILHSNRYYTEGMTRLFNMGTQVQNSWTPENTNTNIPRANVDGATNNARLSDRWVESGDFVRLRFLTLGYTFPEFNNSPFSKVRIYGQAQNLLTFTGYSGYDPEVQGRGGNNSDVNSSNNTLFRNGIDDSVVPNPRTLILGLEFSF